MGARFYCLGGEKFAYRGRFQGTIFTDGERRIEVANTDFSRISGLVDGQFACFYKADVILPVGVDCISTNRFIEAREAEPTVVAPAAAAWGEGFSD